MLHHRLEDPDRVGRRRARVRRLRRHSQPDRRAARGHRSRDGAELPRLDGQRAARRVPLVLHEGIRRG